MGITLLCLCYRLIDKGENLPLDPSSMAQSSQSELICSKPDYRNVLSRQQQRLYTVELVVKTQVVTIIVFVMGFMCLLSSILHDCCSFCICN